MSGDKSFSVKAKYKEILRLNGIHDPVSEIAIRDSDLAGQNFGSQTQLVTITFESPSKKPLNLFSKVMPDNQAHRKVTEEGRLFVKEATFFTTYLPAAHEFCKQLGQENLIAPLYPKCYFGDEKLIVLENLLLDKGCSMVKRGEYDDFDTAALAFKSIAKHHAISRAYIKHAGGPEVVFKQFPALNYDTFGAPWAEEMMGGMMENAAKRGVEILQVSDIPGKEDALNFLRSMLGRVYQNFHGATMIADEDEKFLVLNHGDFHNNNMMHIKDEHGKVTDSILIDLQGTRYGSLCLDLHCYMPFSVQTAVRRGRVRDLLEVYLDTFKKILEHLGHPINMTLDVDLSKNIYGKELEKNYHQKRMHGFWFTMFLENGLLFKITKTLAPEELPEMSAKVDAYLTKFWQENPAERIEHAKELLNVFKEYNPYGLR